MTSRPRIGIHCPGTGNGGPWRYVHSLLKSIDILHYDVFLLCDMIGQYSPRPEIKLIPLNPAPEYPASIRTNAFRQLTSAKIRIPKDVRVIAGFMRNARRLSTILRPHAFDLFHTQNTGCEEAPVAASLAGVPRIIGTFHTDWTYDLHQERNGIAYRFLERCSNRRLRRAIAVSEATGRNWRRRTHIPRPRVVTIHNGVDADQYERKQTSQDARLRMKVAENALVIAGIGRLDEAKGFANLIDAADLLRAAVPNLQIIIAGDGPLRLSLESLANHKNVNVKLIGFVNDVQPLLDAADLFCLPSLCEACPYAVLEAMAAGLPVLGSDVGGVRELVRHGETGLVLPPRDAPAWAAAIRKLALDPALRERFGNAGHERVATAFQERDMVYKTFEIYGQLLKWA